MAFSQTTILKTAESAFGNKWIGQAIAVPSGNLSKVSLYLEPTISDPTIASSAMVVVEVYDLFTYPSGSPLASDSKSLSEIAISGWQNFRLEAAVPTVVAITVRMTGGDENNFISWRYAQIASGGDLLISLDGGTTWTADPTRTFAFVAFSMVPNAVDQTQQTAAIQPGTLESIVDNSSTAFSGAVFNNTYVNAGDTVQIDFGNFVITLVVDQSGSMTWNDAGNLRMKFLTDLISSIDSTLPIGSSATYSIVMFRGRKLSSMSLQIQGAEQFGLHFDGVRVMRRTGTPPTGPGDPFAQPAFSGAAQQFYDQGLTTGTQYYYGAYTFATIGNTTLYSEGQFDYAVPTVGISGFSGYSQVAPLGVASLAASVTITNSVGVPVPPGGIDFGFREVSLAWTNPGGYNYDSVFVVRKTGSNPGGPLDGTVVLTASSSTTSYVDTLGGTYEFINGLDYYYRIFTTTSAGVKCFAANAFMAVATIPVADRPWNRVQPNGQHWPSGNLPPGGFDVTPCATPSISGLIASNGEISLSWTPGDHKTVRYRLYYRDDKYPSVTDDTGLNYDGTLLFDGPDLSLLNPLLNGGTFIHRLLVNNQPNFYALIALDDLQNVSPPLLVVNPSTGLPPEPMVTPNLLIPPPPISGFEVDAKTATVNSAFWENPQPGAPPTTYYFGDSVEVVSTVAFDDDLADIVTVTSEPAYVHQFVVDSVRVGLVNAGSSVDPGVALQFAYSPSASANEVSAIVSVTPLLGLQNMMTSVSVSFHSILSVTSATGEVLAEVQSGGMSLSFRNPFSVQIANSPPQAVSIRTWTLGGQDPETTCSQPTYALSSSPGVYVLSGEPFNAQINASFRGEPLATPLSVTMSLLDPTTGQPSTLMGFPQAAGAGSMVLQTNNVQEETLDRSGEPTGETVTVSTFDLALPPGNVPGNVTLQAAAQFSGYSAVVQLPVSYQPVLNVDMNNVVIAADGVDRVELSAFVYLAPFDAPQSQKAPVADFTVTNWSITPLCPGISTTLPLYSKDTVPGAGVKAYTHEGMATNVFVGPVSNPVNAFFQVEVTVQANGMSGTGHCIVAVNTPQPKNVNRIFLKNPTGFYQDSIYADGVAVSTWEVIADPANDGDISNETSGKFFWNGIVKDLGGLVPTLTDGSIVTLFVASVIDNSANGVDSAKIINGTMISSNMTTSTGRPAWATATVEGGVATFQVSCDAWVPSINPNLTETEQSASTEQNILYGSLVGQPNASVILVLGASTIVDVNGNAVSFQGGGGSVVNSTPPAFLVLREPLTSA